MKIAGFKKQSLIDYPGNISSVVFTQGCNFRCGFCHNPELVDPQKFRECINAGQLFDYFQRYNKLLDAVCISGGEPTLHKELPDFIKKVKALNLKVKLDSNGTNPEMLHHLLQNNMLDFIAMDIKHILEFEHYYQASGNWIRRDAFLNIMKSIVLIENSGINYEFRTTIVKGLHTINHIKNLKARFGSHYKIQQFRPEVVLNSSLKLEAFSDKEYNEIVNQ